ncbi:competence/damage-inducible protein A [Candidatus Riflebacteria bacterium]
MSKDNMDAGIVIIGNEVLKGQVDELNSKWLSNRLFDKGILIRTVCIIPDNIENIVETVTRERSRVAYLFVTGGIGPTHDDMTRQAIARAFSCNLKYNDKIAYFLEKFYGRRTNEKVLSMALIPELAKPLADNPALPGFQIENVFVFPGYPRYMKIGFEGIEGLLPGKEKYCFNLVTYLDESIIAEAIEKLEKDFPQVNVGSYPDGYESCYRVRLDIFSFHQISFEKACETLKNEIKNLENKYPREVDN